MQYSVKKVFLDIAIINTDAGKCEFKVHPKNAVTNIQIKPHFFVNPSLIKSIFEGFVSSAKKLFTKKYFEY